MAQLSENPMFAENPPHSDGGSPDPSYERDPSTDPCVGFEANNELSPGSSDDSNESGDWLPPVSPIPDDIFEPKKEQKGHESNEPDELSSANVTSVEICPFCGYRAVFCMTLIYEEICCLNENCTKVCCRRCRAETHIPSTCKEAAKKRAREERRVAARELEEALSATMVHRCNRCKRSFDKTSGSNWIVCPVCDNKQCYICRADAPFFSHFDGSSAGTCSLWGLRLATVRQVHEVKTLLAEMKEEREIARYRNVPAEAYYGTSEEIQRAESDVDQRVRTMESAKQEWKQKTFREQDISPPMDNTYPNAMFSNDEPPTGDEDELSTSRNIWDDTTQATQLHRPAYQQKEDMMMIDVNLGSRQCQPDGTFPINETSAVPLPGMQRQPPAQESISSTWYMENWQQQQQNVEYYPINQQPQVMNDTQLSKEATEPQGVQLHGQSRDDLQLPESWIIPVNHEALQRLRKIIMEKLHGSKDAQDTTPQPETLPQTQLDHQLQASPQSQANSHPQSIDGTLGQTSPLQVAHEERSQAPQQPTPKSEAINDYEDTDLESNTESSQTSDWELDEPIPLLPRIDWEVDTPARPVMPTTPQLQPVEPVRYTDGFASDAYFRQDMDFGQGYDDIEWGFSDMMETEWYHAGLDGTSARGAGVRDE